ncbi:hypothetical protein D6C92_06385 [Aureobasidium pullulans]|nr:hypothetical protein D6C92_06385 [Aureobasidium pullulans]
MFDERELSNPCSSWMHCNTLICLGDVLSLHAFLGKVVVQELCRRQLQNLLPAHKILLLVRPSKDKTAAERFTRIAKAICFSKLEGTWQDLVQVIEGDLCTPDLGLQRDVYADLARRVTHIIHCAASIDFDLPLQEATRSNVDTTMNILELARKCPNLRQLVDTSTAYVSTCQEGTIAEELAPIPMNMSPSQLHYSIQKGLIDEAELLASSGHANTYTVTKCLSEHLLFEEYGNVPVTVVRPSIISAAQEYPFPGYIDSYAAMGGFISLFGSGFLHVIECDPTASFDVVPVDFVANRQTSTTKGSFKIVHCVAGLKDSISTPDFRRIGLDYFANVKSIRKPFWAYTGPRDWRYYWYKWTSQTIPLQLATWFFAAIQNKAMSKQMTIIKRGIEKVDATFPYFCLHTFDFATERRIDGGFASIEYIQVMIQGVHRHLLRRELYVE